MKRIVPVLLLLLFFGSAYAQTPVTGGLYGSSTWTLSGSPYIVSGNFVVFADVTLTIDPGVVVRFESGASLELRGTLSAIGTAAKPIAFTSNAATPQESDWDGIRVIGTSSPTGTGSQVTMEYCTGSYAATFIDLDIAYHGPYVFRHCTFTHNRQVNNDGGSPITVFEYCVFDSNYSGLTPCQFDSRAAHCRFTRNVYGLNGIQRVDSCYFSGNTGVALAPYGTTNACIVENNAIGVKCYFNSVNHSFVNSQVSNNTIGIQMLSYFNGSITFTGNTICNNATYNVQLNTQNNADLSNNCWCTNDSAAIRAKISDGYKNTSYGLVSFTPLAGSCPDLSRAGVSVASVVPLQASVSPNPFTDRLDITVGTEEETELSLYDVTSKKVAQQRFTGRTSVNTARLTSGIYIYELRTAQGRHAAGKIIRQ